VYNRATTVLDALQSVVRQSVLPRRLVVVDDGSNDATPDAITRWMKQVRNVETCLITQPNAGPSVARNRGSLLADDCKFIAFLDSDDLWPTDFIERMTAQMKPAPQAVAATCNMRYVHVGGHTPAFLQSLPDRSSEGIARNPSEWLMLNTGGITPATMVRLTALRQVGGYDANLRYGEDLILYLKLSRLGPWLHVAGEPVTIRYGVASARGEEGHLQLTERPWKVEGLCALSAFINDFHRHGGRHPSRAVAQKISFYCECAARQLAGHKRYGEALRAYQRALAWRPTNPKLWVRVARATSGMARRKLSGIRPMSAGT
jgi:glycosyltransferase involved in cell wall biosynthesis